MKVVHSDAHLRHQPEHIISRGRPQDHFEIARRVEELARAARRDGHDLVSPGDYGSGPRAAVHTPEYLDFPERAFGEWQALDDPTPAVQAHAYPHRRMQARPTGIVGLAGYHMGTNSCPIVDGTWEAACAAADIAVHAARFVLDGAPVAYALCRPPGHHAFSDIAGGFCYLNNAAIAAQYMRRSLGRVAILDVDVHHGNGTQGIFYDRGDVFFVSLHGDPSDFFPFYAGYAHESGEGAGSGYTLNLPLPPDTGDRDYLAALDRALAAIRHFAPDALLVSLGFDAYEHDPLGILKVTTGGFGEIARRIAAAGLPTVLVQEGGYNCDALGANLSAFLTGFERGRASSE